MSYYIIPIYLLLIFIFALFNDSKPYDSFIKGAKEGMKMCVTIFPFLLSMIVATSLLSESGLIEDIFSFFKVLEFPYELITQGMFRPLSSSASLAVMIDIFDKYGVDSLYGIMASVVQGSTDTTLYVITLYFGSVGVIKYRYAIKVGLLVDLFAFIASVIIVSLMIN